MKWSGYVFSAMLGGALVSALYVADPEAPPPPVDPLDQVALQLAQQTVLLERIVVVLDRWDGADQAGTAKAEARQKRVMDGWKDWTKDGGLDALPKTLK